MFNGRKKTFAERLIHFTHAVSGSSLRKTNQALRKAGFPPIPPSSWRMLLQSYVPALKADPTKLLQFSVRPPTVKQLAAA